MPNFIEIGLDVAQILQFSIFQDGSCPPFWICLPHFWTTHKAYLAVYTCVKNLVGIHAVVLIMWNFEYFACFGLKIPIHVPKITVLGGIWPLNGRYNNMTPKRHTLAWKYVIWRIDRQNRSTGATCAMPKEPKKQLAQITHVVQSKYRLAWWVIPIT